MVERNDRQRYTPPYDRAAYQKGILRDQKKEAPNEQNLASTREGSVSSYASASRES